MADSVLKELSSSSLFDLTGVVAVVTGGGTVGVFGRLPNSVIGEIHASYRG